MFTSDDYFHITNAQILNENVNHLDERRYEPDEKLPSGKTPSEKMKERENEHRRAATSQGGGSRGDAKNRSLKIGSIRGAIERGEDPRADGYGGARAARGNPPEDHRAAFSKNPLNKPPRRVKEPGVKKEEFDVITEYLFVEGYADTIESAELIAESISEQWVNEILESREQELRNKYGLNPGEVSARLAKRTYRKIDDITIPDNELDQPYQNLYHRASERAQGRPNVEWGIRSRGGGAGSGSERDRGNIPKPERLQQWVDGKRTSPNMTADERRRAHRR